MCRFLAWIGEPRFIEDLVLDQKQSHVAQSRNALIGKTLDFMLSEHRDEDAASTFFARTIYNNG